LIVLKDGQRSWTAAPEDLGVVIDIPTMAAQALAVGRSGNLFDRVDQQLLAWNEGVRQPPLVLFDQRTGKAYLETLAADVDRPTTEAAVLLDGTQVSTRAGQIGRQLVIGDTLEALRPPISQMHDAQIELVIVDSPPIVLDAEPDADRARALLSGPLQFTADGVDPVELPAAEVAGMLQFEPIEGEGRYAFSLNENLVRAILEPIAPNYDRAPQNARFIFNDDSLQLDLLEPAVIGRQLNLEQSLQAVSDGVDAGQHAIPLAFDTTDPEVKSDATGEELGITENVAAVSTYFSGSSSARVQNIETASSAFHGLLVAPGETLSMAEVLGDISLDKGYAEALIIYGDRTIKGVGGGVCQVSTTLFRAAFYGGYQIDERHPHAYRVLYYEQGPNSPGPGLDATVFVPLVDFKFTNDSEHWLLLETYMYNNRQLLWKFYSTNDGRTVNWSSSGPRNEVEAPEPLYKKNNDLDKGEIEQVDYEADGMDVTVTRTVTRDGQTLHDDEFRTHYLPWRAIYEYGPGTDLPDDAKTED
jgi:vancomycin resistance protein YoaR